MSDEKKVIKLKTRTLELCGFSDDEEFVNEIIEEIRFNSYIEYEEEIYD